MLCYLCNTWGVGIFHPSLEFQTYSNPMPKTNLNCFKIILLGKPSEKSTSGKIATEVFSPYLQLSFKIILHYFKTIQPSIEALHRILSKTPYYCDSVALTTRIELTFSGYLKFPFKSITKYGSKLIKN